MGRASKGMRRSHLHAAGPSVERRPPVASPATGPRAVIRLASTVLAISGFWLERLTIPWAILGVASLALVHRTTLRANSPSLSIAYFVFTLVFYYGGNSIVLGSSIPRRLIASFGERRALRMYECVLAMMFIHQGLGVGVMTSMSSDGEWTLPIPHELAHSVGSVLFALGLTVKVWATRVVSVEIYYYRDMFLNRRIAPFASDGPYKLLSNPMYGIGQLHGYGYAIWNRSLTGLVAIAICHALIYVFYYAVERPFVRRICHTTESPALSVVA